MIKKIKAWWQKLTLDQPPVPEGYFRCEQCGQPCEEEYKMVCSKCSKVICDDCAVYDLDTKKIVCPDCW